LLDRRQSRHRRHSDDADAATQDFTSRGRVSCGFG